MSEFTAWYLGLCSVMLLAVAIPLYYENWVMGR